MAARHRRGADRPAAVPGEDISEQFEDWDHRADAIYFDEETGMLMRSVTVPGGDVEQVPYEP